MTSPDPVTLALIIARILERLGVRYCIGGSVASSVYGEVRPTFEVDVVADLGPEDVVIQKLRWYEMGGQVSDRQWRDVLGVLKVQREQLDLAYLERAAASLDLSELLARARSEAIDAPR